MGLFAHYMRTSDGFAAQECGVIRGGGPKSPWSRNDTRYRSSYVQDHCSIWA
jgi:hypothetical protein